MNSKRRDRAKKKQREQDDKKRGLRPFRAAVLRGLGLVLPPLLTIVIFIWVGSLIREKLLLPVVGWTQGALVWMERDLLADGPAVLLAVSEENLPEGQRGKEQPIVNGVPYYLTGAGPYYPVGYQRLDNGTFVPKHVFQVASERHKGHTAGLNADEVYQHYVRERWLRPIQVVPCFLALFILFLYLTGKFMAAGVGRVFWTLFENGVNRVPLVRNVYGSAKQVSDFFLAERELEFSRVVAAEWPRKGIWIVSLVTGESLAQIEDRVGEPVLSVLIPTSPFPLTGFTVTLKKSETIDLDITIDQAVQFIVSCGVSVPPSQMKKLIGSSELDSRLVASSEDD